MHASEMTSLKESVSEDADTAAGVLGAELVHAGHRGGRHSSRKDDGGGGLNLGVGHLALGELQDVLNGHADEYGGHRDEGRLR